MKVRLIEKQRQIVENLEEIRRVIGRPPITLVFFRDCGTNYCLAREMNRIFQEEGNYPEYVNTLQIDFECGKDLESLERRFDGMRLEFERQCREGSIVIVGGSYFNPDESEGNFFRRTYGKIILESIAPSDARSRALFICFGHQNAATFIGERYRKQLPHLVSLPGALEFCPTPVEVTQKDHPLFRDCPPQFTLMNTHGRHVCGLEAIPENMRHIVDPLARSVITGLPLICSYYDGRGIGIQPHAEVDIRSEADRRRIMGEIRPHTDSLRRGFNVDPHRLHEMWKEAAAHVTGNAGEHIHANAMLDLTGSFPYKEIRSRRQTRLVRARTEDQQRGSGRR